VPEGQCDRARSDAAAAVTRVYAAQSSKRGRVAQASGNSDKIYCRSGRFNAGCRLAKSGCPAVLQVNREVTSSPCVLSRVLVSAASKLYSNVCLQHSLRVSVARGHTIECRMAFRVEYGLSERD